MKISKRTAVLALSLLTTLLMGLSMGSGGAFVWFILLPALMLVVGVRFAFLAHEDNKHQSHTSLTHIVLEKPTTEIPTPGSQHPSANERLVEAEGTRAP